MATFGKLPGGSPTLSVWVIAIREAAEAGTVPATFKAVTRADVAKAAAARGIPVRENRIFEGYAGEVYFGLREQFKDTDLMPIPPIIIRIMWCPECGRNDRSDFLRLKHRPPFDSTVKRVKGGLCPGKPIRVEYKFASREDKP